MNKKYEYVFSPMTVNGVEFKNRIQVAPMLLCMATPGGMATQEMVEFHRAGARTGAAIVTIGDSMISFAFGKDHESELDLGTNDVITGLSQIVEGITRYGAVASIELNHGGANTFVEGRHPMSASSLPTGNEEFLATMEGRLPRIVEEISQDKIGDIIQGYADAAYRCMTAGFRMVLVHGAHGHLIGQFLSPLTNKRTDRWGGSLENRARFAIATLDAIRKKCGAGLVIEYRVSMDEKKPGGLGPDQVIEFLKMIEDKIDILHVSAGLLTHPFYQYHLIQPMYVPHMYNVHYAELAKKHLNIPITAVGSIMNLDYAEKILSEGWADFVAMARPLVADPKLIRKSVLGRNEEIRPCIRCNVCASRPGYGLLPRCSINPIAGRNLEYPTEDSIMPALEKKKILIVGGGPAGMQATLTAIKRGHEVVLYEMTDKLGGMLITGSQLPFKKDLKGYLEWLVVQTEKSGATIRYNVDVTPEIVNQEKPDVLIIAVGAVPLIPDIPGVDRPNVCWAGDVGAGKAEVGETVIVVGAGLTGVETALHLVQEGKKVTIIEMMGPDAVVKDELLISKNYLLAQLSELKIPVITHTKVEAVTDTGVRTINNTFKTKFFSADTVLFATGMKARKDKVNELRRLVPETEVSVIGDCYEPRRLMNATHDGFNAMVDI